MITFGDKIRLRVLFTAILLATISTVAAQRVYVGGLYYDIDPDTKTASVAPLQDGVQIIGQITEAYPYRNIAVPSSIDIDGVTYTVESIGGSAFSHSDVETIQLPPTLKRLSPSAFREAFNLQEIVLPPGVELGDGAFRNASGLRKVILPEDITTIPQRAFEGTALTQIALPPTVTSIATLAYTGVSPEEGIFLNEGLTIINENAFKGNAAGNSGVALQLTIPSTVKEISNNAFEDSPVSELWFMGSPATVNAVKSFAGMAVENIVWATSAKPFSGLTVGVKDESSAKLYYDYESFSQIKPSVKISSDRNVTTGTKSPKGQTAEVLAALPPVSFRKGHIDLNDYTGLCHLTDLKYESRNAEIASVDANGIVTFHKAGTVTIVTSSASESDDRLLAGKERQLCIMPMTVVVEVDADGAITYRSGDLGDEEIKARLTREASLSTIKVKDQNDEEWAIRCAAGAEGDGMAFVYGAMPPTLAGPEVELAPLPAPVRYGDAPIDMTEVDSKVASEWGEITYHSSDAAVIKVDGSLLYPIGVGTVEITAVCGGVEFANGGVRQIEVSPREVTARANKVTIEDDAASLPAVEYTVIGLAGDDKPKSIIQAWEWDNARIEEGVYAAAMPLLADNPLYSVTVDTAEGRLYVVRAVTRVVAEIEFADDAPQAVSMVLTLSGACRVKCGETEANEQAESIVLPIMVSETGCTVLCDYPEHITGIELTDAGVSRIEIAKDVTELKSLDLSGNNLTPGALVLNNHEIELITGDQEEISVSVVNDNEISLGNIGAGITAKWYSNEGNLLAEGTDYTHASGIYTFLKPFSGIYAELSDGLVTARTTPVDVKTNDEGNGDDKDPDGDDKDPDNENKGDGPTSGRDDISAESANRIVDVYTLSGMLVKRNVAFSSATKDLAPGIYIIGGKLYQVR